MATYIVKPNQNLFDVALHLYGSIEGLFDLLITNDWLNMNTDLETGMEIEYHEDFVINSSIVDTFHDENIVPSNGGRHVYNKLIDTPLAMTVLVNTDIVKVDNCGGKILLERKLLSVLACKGIKPETPPV